MPNKTLDLIVNQPPAGFISHDAQMLVAVGICLFLVLWGLAKVFAAFKWPPK
jgi:hypothetical protein